MQNEALSKPISTKSLQNTSRGRRSRSQKFFKIGDLKHFTIFTGKILCWSLFLINLQAFWPATFLQLYCRTLTQVLSCEYCTIFKNSFFYRTPLVAASLVAASLLNPSSKILYLNGSLWIFHNLYSEKYISDVSPNLGELFRGSFWGWEGGKYPLPKTC